MTYLLHHGESFVCYSFVTEDVNTKKITVQHNVPQMLAPSFRSQHFTTLFLHFPLTLEARMYCKENFRFHISCTVQYSFILFFQNLNNVSFFTVGVQKVSDFRTLLISTVENRNIYVASLCKSFKTLKQNKAQSWGDAQWV